MNVDHWPDCLGCSDEPSRREVVFPTSADGHAESPVGLYGDPAHWCRPCWTHRGPFDRFHLLYGQRLRNYTRALLRHLPSGLREMAVDDVTAETMEALWKQREKLRVPERAMYCMAKRIARRRFPLDPAEVPADLLEDDTSEDDPADALIDRLLLEEELAKLPQKTREYLYEHKGLGKTAKEVADDHGVSKGTVTESVRRGLDTVRPALDYINIFASILTLIRLILELFVDE